MTKKKDIIKSPVKFGLPSFLTLPVMNKIGHKQKSQTCGSDEPLPEIRRMEDEQDKVDKVEHVGQVEHLEVTAAPDKIGLN
jgi:hypothetical protein